MNNKIDYIKLYSELFNNYNAFVRTSRTSRHARAKGTDLLQTLNQILRFTTSAKLANLCNKYYS